VGPTRYGHQAEPLAWLLLHERNQAMLGQPWHEISPVPGHKRICRVASSSFCSARGINQLMIVSMLFNECSDKASNAVMFYTLQN
jgi:hypothetical protein